MAYNYGKWAAIKRNKKNTKRKADAAEKARNKANKTNSIKSEPEIKLFEFNYKKYKPTTIEWSDSIEIANELKDRIQNNQFQLLKMPTGFGKTATAIQTLAQLQLAQKDKINFIVLASRKIVDKNGWQNTLMDYNEKHKNNILKPIIIDTFDRFANILDDHRSLRKINKLLPNDTIIVIDEVQNYKNPTSKRAKKLAIQTKRFKKLGLSASPLTNDVLLDGCSYLIFNQQFTSKTDFYKKMNLERWLDEYNVPNVYDEHGQIDKVLWNKYDDFKKLLADVIYQPDIKESDIEIPSIDNRIIQIENSSQLNEDVNSLANAYKNRMFDSIMDYILELIERIMIDENRIKKIVEICKDKKHKQPLIFYLYTAIGDKYEEALKNEGFKPQRIMGGTDISTIDSESSEPILIQYQAGSEGIEFKNSNCTIFAQTQHSYTTIVQARGRNVRRGQSHMVYQFSLISDVYYERQIFNVVSNREECSTKLLEEIANEQIKDYS